MTGTMSQNRRKALAALLTEPTIRAAAKAAGVGEATVFRYLRDPDFRAQLRSRQDEVIAATTAALAGLSEEAIEKLRGTLNLLANQAAGSVEDFIQVDDRGGWTLDLAKAEEAGLLPLIKKLWADKDGNDRLELHDAQAAAAKLGHLVLGILTERRRATELDDLAERVASLERSLGAER